MTRKQIAGDFVDQWEIGTNCFETVRWGVVRVDSGRAGQSVHVEVELPNRGSASAASEEVDPAIVDATDFTSECHTRKQMRCWIDSAVQGALSQIRVEPKSTQDRIDESED